MHAALACHVGKIFEGSRTEGLGGHIRTSSASPVQHNRASTGHKGDLRESSLTFQTQPCEKLLAIRQDSADAQAA